MPAGVGVCSPERGKVDIFVLRAEKLLEPIMRAEYVKSNPSCRELGVGEGGKENHDVIQGGPREKAQERR